MEHREYHEALSQHALDALDASEARGVEEHVVTCASCRDELRALRDTAALLAHAVTPTAPSAEVRARILAAAHAEPKRQPARLASNVIAITPRTTNLSSNLLRIAAAIAIVALLIGVSVLWRREIRMRREIATLSRQLNTQQQELAQNRELLSRQSEILVLLNSPDAKKMSLAGSQTAIAAHGTFVFDEKTGHGALMAEGLPATPAGKAYELWFIPKGRSPIPGKVFTVDASGHVTLPQQVPAEAFSESVIAVSLEPGKGSTAPTGAIYLSSPGL
jgi:anti-sigma-K factor RskA